MRRLFYIACPTHLLYVRKLTFNIQYYRVIMNRIWSVARLHAYEFLSFYSIFNWFFNSFNNVSMTPISKSYVEMKLYWNLNSLMGTCLDQLHPWRRAIDNMRKFSYNIWTITKCNFWYLNFHKNVVVLKLFISLSL